jgi:hypothetical protein
LMVATDAIPALLIALASGVVLGIAVLLIIYRMIDGNLHVGVGICALVMILVAMSLAVRPPHPAVPGVVLVSALALMAFFPFAEQKLEEFELRAVDAGRMAKSYKAIEVRPDNFAAKFELAKVLHEHGFGHHAIFLAKATLGSLSDEKDEVRNRSMRDVFHREELLLRRWQTEGLGLETQKCPGCGTNNAATEIFCAGCGRPYLLDIVQGQEVRPRVWAKLVLSWAGLALFIPAVVAIAMNLDGMVRFGAFVGAFVAIGALLAWLFKPPKHSVPVWSVD